MLEKEFEDAIKHYDDNLVEFTQKPICLVEGNNTFFYQKIEELYPYIIQNGHSSNAIKSNVKNSNCKIGIIDNDYDNTLIENIIKIDYYSIENIALELIPEFKILKDLLEQEIRKHGLEEVRKCHIEVKFFPKDIKNKNINLKLCGQYTDGNRINYVNSKIKDLRSLNKFKDLKKAIEGTHRFLKMKHQKNIQYINELHSYMEKKSIQGILSEEEYVRFCIINKSIGES
ncbi:MAG: hypothetical protein Q4A77_09475 [Leptotrichia hongkongensis]|nr:hypothetical protein [Leptotrichia hongkongensis]